MSKTLKITLGYSNTDFTRQYKIEHDAIGTPEQAEAAINALNASIAGGTDGGFADFFRADDYDATDPNNIVGKCIGVVSAQIDALNEYQLNI